MKRIISSLLILAATTFVADARFIDARPFEEMEKTADIIVVAKPVSTEDTDEQTNLSSFKPPVPVVGLSSEFEVSLVLKGDNSLKKLVVHHYRSQTTMTNKCGTILDLPLSIRRIPRTIYCS
jgi:hypothetical protein